MRNPTNILYVISSLANEGPTRVLLNLVRNIDRNKFAPSIATLTTEKGNSLLADFLELGIPIAQLAAKASGEPRGTIGRIRALRAHLKDGGFRLAHAHCPRSLFFLAAAKPEHTRSVYTLHIYPKQQYKVIHGVLKGTLITAVSNALIGMIDKTIACSDSVAYEYSLHKGLSFPSVNNGIEAMDISALPGRAVLLQRLGLNPERRYFLFVGRLSAEKRIIELVHSFTRIRPTDVDLVIVGSGEDEAILRDSNSPHVHIMGFHSDIRPFLAACDFYISPSSTEGLANSLLEAMSIGMPSLLSDIPSHRFVLDACEGFVGLLFDPISDESLREGIACILRQELEPVRAAIRENFQAHFHAQTMARGYEAIYGTMIV